MEDQYRAANLRRYVGGGSSNYFPSISPSSDFQPSLISSSNPYDMLMFAPNYAIVNNSTTSAGESSSAAAGGLIGGGGDGGGTVRWPRQETLTLLEIRSRLDPKFKEANQKGPLWDEVSRIMSEEHGYQRSGKKCREKFDNLYKYYKKTKDGNARKRHGGKHYRFFRQLEALYGDQTTNSASLLETPSLVFGSFHYNHPTNNVSSAYDHQDSYHCPKISETTTPSNSCESDSTSSDESDPNIGMESNDPRRKKRRGLKAKIRESIGAQMKKLMDKQEAWMEKMMNAIEHKERERMVREEQWRKQDEARIEMQHKLWASERAWMEARDAAIMDAFRNLTGRETTARASSGQRILREKTGNDIWQDCEITRMIELRSEMGLRSQQGGISEEAMWDEIAAGMARFGHHRTALMCRDKWDSVNDYLIKKRMENESSVCNEGGLVIPYCESSEAGIGDAIVRLNNHHGDSINDHSCFRYSFGL